MLGVIVYVRGHCIYQGSLYMLGVIVYVRGHCIC